MKDPLPRATVHAAIFDFVREHDLVVFGAQAVNLYVPDDDVRMTADVDMMSPTPAETAKGLAEYLRERFHVAMRIRRAKGGYRIYQPRKEGPRHLADVRPIEEGLPTIRQHGIRYPKLPTLVAMKLMAYQARKNAPKGATDLADLRRLLLAHPELREGNAVLKAIGTDASPDVNDAAFARHAWFQLLGSRIEPDQ